MDITRTIRLWQLNSRVRNNKRKYIFNVISYAKYKSISPPWLNLTQNNLIKLNRFHKICYYYCGFLFFYNYMDQLKLRLFR